MLLEVEYRCRQYSIRCSNVCRQTVFCRFRLLQSAASTAVVLLSSIVSLALTLSVCVTSVFIRVCVTLENCFIFV